MNRITPYQRLLEQFRAFASEVECPETRTMWVYPKDKLDDGWDLRALADRVAAAEQLGHDVVLKATDQGLAVKYVKKRPRRPFNL